MPDCEGEYTRSEEHSERPVYTHEEYLNLVLRSGHVMTHDYSHQSTDEDPRMMAFFDSLVQRELEGWTSEDSSVGSELLERILHASSPSEHSEDDDSQNPDTPDAFLDAMNSVISSSDTRSPNSSPRAGQSNPRCSLPGQRQNADRKTISSLVAQRKRMSDIKRTQQEKRARKESRLRRTRGIARILSSLTQDSSDSSESDAPDNNVSSPEDVASILRLKRLKDLRDHIFNSDSSDDGLGTSTRTSHSQASSSNLSSFMASTPVLDMSLGLDDSDEALDLSTKSSSSYSKDAKNGKSSNLNNGNKKICFEISKISSESDSSGASYAKSCDDCDKKDKKESKCNADKVSEPGASNSGPNGTSKCEKTKQGDSCEFRSHKNRDRRKRNYRRASQDHSSDDD